MMDDLRRVGARFSMLGCLLLLAASTWGKFPTACAAGEMAIGKTPRGQATTVLKATLRDQTANSDGANLASRVMIRRTQFGVPHIQADSFEALGFGFGYCQAEDHLPSILRGIVMVRGEMAATFGPDEERAGDGKHLESDLFQRQFRVYQRAVDSYHKLDPDYRTLCEGFAAGLNYYTQKHSEQVPEWTPHVTGHDVVAYGLAGVMRFAFNRGDVIGKFLNQQQRLGQHDHQQNQIGADSTTGDESLDALDFGRWAAQGIPARAEVGSNMWALAPSRSQSGRAMLMGNPHQPWAPVSTYYEAHLIVPGKLNFYGSTFIGRPVLTSGWNEHLGWSHTVNYPDLEEIYELKLDPEQADHYVFDGDALPLASDEVRIRVRHEGGEQIVSRTFWHTPLGPVIHRTADKAYVLRSACWENYRAYEQWLKMTRCQSLAEFRKTLAMNQLPMFNICYADRAGNIFYLWNGTVPRLPHAAHKAEAVPAQRTADVWTEFLSTDELPQLLNPPGGYVQNCNSPPYFTNLKMPLERAAFPAYFPDNNLSLRSQHSLLLVATDEQLSLEEVCRRKHSPLMLLAERVKADLTSAVRSDEISPQVDTALSAIEQWDNTVSADSRGGTLFVDWWQRYSAAGGGHAVEWSAENPTTTPRGLSNARLARSAFLAAVEALVQSDEPANASWGETHRWRKGAIDLPLSGGSGLLGCFRVLDFRAVDDGKQVARGGDSYVFAVEFSQPPRCYSVLAYSQSEIPDSPHFADQAELFSAGKMKRAAYSDDEIAQQLLRQYHPGDE